LTALRIVWLCTVISLTSGLLIPLSVVAQERVKKARTNPQADRRRQFDIFSFPYLENGQVYFSARRLDKIDQALSAGKEEKAYHLLRRYVYRFRVVNFRRDGRLLSELADLSSEFGPPGEDLTLRKILLKHQSSGVDSLYARSRYDSMESSATKYFMPAVQYYEMTLLRKLENDSIPAPSRAKSAGDLLNSKYADYAPAIGNRDDLLLFTSKRNLHSTDPGSPPDEDLFISTREDGIWNKATELRGINTNLNEGSACLSRDGKTLIFSRCYGPGSAGSCDLYQAILSPDSVWTAIRNLGPLINSPGWDSHPALSPAGDTLYFASNRLGGFGMSDIYFSVRDDRGNWQKAKNLGPVINTRLSEVSPFIHHRYDVLYFSSDGMPVGFGDFDIYLSRSENSRRGEPVNAGPLVNGPGSDYYFTLDAASSEIFYSRPSVDGATGLDIWSVPLPMEAHPQADILLTGKISREDGTAAGGITYVFDLDRQIEIAPRFLSAGGTFNFNLIRNRRYLVVVEGEGFRKLEEKIFLDGSLNYERTVENEIPKIAFASVEFEAGRADILPTMISDLQKLGRLLSEHPELKVKISGHADAAGEAIAHQELSQKRADAVRDFLIAEHHISGERIFAIGYGSTQPLISLSDTDSSRRINRRVEFEIYN
jgi:outer membrane protein OmpA-like peptidoglycan-associated protein